MAIAYRMLAKIFGAADGVWPQRLLPSLAPEKILRVAPDLSGAARAGLVRLLESVAAESELSLFGRLSLRWDVQRLMQNAAGIAAAHRARPDLGASPVAAPIFILGLPRSGTSFLHALLAQDADNSVPRVWQTIYPLPHQAGAAAVRTVDRQLRMFDAFAPGFAALHPMDADSPQECSEITAHVFQSLRFDTTFRVPGYQAWLERHGHADAFSFHKRFLQVLQDGVPARWVLKSPDHTFTIDAILATYPDARFVVVHRDPMAVLASNARLTEILRKPFLRNVDAQEIGAQEARRWTEGANLLLEFDQRRDVPAARKLHLHHDDLVAAPLAAVAAIYAQFDMPLSPQAASAMSAYIAVRPNGGYAKHAPYTLDAFKISAELLRPQFAPYVSTYCRS
jgi:hypothetical protein